MGGRLPYPLQTTLIAEDVKDVKDVELAESVSIAMLTYWKR